MDHHSHRPMRALYWIFLLLLFLPQDSLANHHPTGRFPLQLLKLPSTNLPSISEQTKWPRFGLNSTNKKKKIEKEQDEVTSGETKDDDNSSSSSNKSSSNPSKKPSWKQIRKPEYKSDKKNARFSLPRLFGSRKNQKPKQITSSDRNTNKKVNIPLDTEPKDNKWPPRLRRFRQSNQGKEEGENPNSSSDIQHEYNDDTNDTVLETQPANETEVEVDPQPSSNITEKATTTSTEANATTTSSDDLERSTRQPRQPYPGLVMYGGPPPMYSRPAPMSNRPHVPGMPTNQALAVTAIVSLLSVISRLWIVMWITKRLSSENELIDPVQHFVWECLNDRYTKDQSVLVKALSRPPVGFSRHQWNKFIKRLKEKPTKDAKKTKSKKEIPNKTVVVVDITPNNQLDLQYISDVVNFLTRVHSQNGFGSTVEVVLLLRSPGGPVTTYGLAAAQVARLEEVGMKTTVCVDDVAASGGYMMASQTSQIVAAPFAMVRAILFVYFPLVCLIFSRN